MIIVLWVFATLFVLVGILGTFLPALPGVPFVFVGLLLAAWIDGFAKVTVTTMVVLGGLTLLSLVIDFVAAAYGAKHVQASKLAIIGALIGTIAGIAGGVFGILFGPLIGAFIGEYLAQQNKPGDPFARASEVGFATWFGMILGMVTKIGLSFGMVAIFIAAYFWK